MLQLALATALLLPSFGAFPGPLQGLNPVASRAQEVADDLFPPATTELVIGASTANSTMSVQDLVRLYGEATSQQITYSQETKTLLAQTRIHFDRQVEVPIAQVQTVFEALLRQNEFYLSIMISDGVRILEVRSLRSSERVNARSGALFVPEESFTMVRDHPALLFSTVLHLPHTDVRQLSNSMRTMITDANTMQLLPAGNSHSMVIVGFGDTISNLAESLRIIDDAAAASVEARKLEYHVVTLKKGNAEDMAALLLRVLRIDPESSGATQVIADARTNSLVITATHDVMETVKSLVTRLDV